MNRWIVSYKKSRLPRELIARLRDRPLQPKNFGMPNMMPKHAKKIEAKQHDENADQRVIYTFEIPPD
jgi:hypothetical protein